jgi:hypothetical protein
MNLKKTIIQKSFTIQGVTIDSKKKEYGKIPIFNISPRRSITDYFSYINEYKKVNQDFDEITVNADMYPGTPYAIVFEVGVITDFWYGYKNVRLSNTGMLILHHDEELEQINWGQNDNSHYPIIQTNKRNISPDNL